MFKVEDGAVINTKSNRVYRYGDRLTHKVQYDGIWFGSLNQLAFYLCEGKVAGYPVSLIYEAVGYRKLNFRSSYSNNPGKYEIKVGKVVNVKTGKIYDKLSNPIMYHGHKFLTLGRLAYYLIYGELPKAKVRLKNEQVGFVRGNFENVEDSGIFYKVSKCMAMVYYNTKSTDHSRNGQQNCFDIVISALSSRSHIDIHTLIVDIENELGYSFNSKLWDDDDMLTELHKNSLNLLKLKNFEPDVDLIFGTYVRKLDGRNPH